MMSMAVPSSKFPVGSSAKIIGAVDARARAIATRCCWPPDNRNTLRWISFSLSPSCSKLSLLA